MDGDVLAGLATVVADVLMSGTVLEAMDKNIPLR